MDTKLPKGDGNYEKELAIVCLTIIAAITIAVTGKDGLDVIINIVCGLAGFVTGNAIKDKEATP